MLQGYVGVLLDRYFRPWCFHPRNARRGTRCPSRFTACFFFGVSSCDLFVGKPSEVTIEFACIGLFLVCKSCEVPIDVLFVLIILII